MSYELKAVKMAGGDETPRFEAKIYKDGKQIATVYNEGCGGCNGYIFQGGRNCPEETAFHAFAQNWCKDNNHETSEPDDMWVFDGLDTLEENKKLRRLSKKKTLFRLKGEPKGEWRTVTVPYSPQVQTYLDKKYGDKVEEIFKVAV